uniref:G-patch domain-containing protein n=1 Tax=Myripristis murdjan TaxID=586833 RepID=A0A667WGZ2_9TELE
MTALGYFTAASEQDATWIYTAEQSRPQTSSVLSGEEARQFYESLTKDDEGPEKQRSTAVRRRRNNHRDVQQGQTDTAVERGIDGEGEGVQRGTVTRQGSDSERSTELQGLKLLRCAQEGDLSGLRELLSRGVDINFQDSFFWTAVMCASWAGQRAALRLLLQRGAAWVGVVDTQGRDARELALAGPWRALEEVHSRTHDLTPQWCHVCESQYSSSLSSHLSSTLHQFSLRHPQPTPHYCLPPSSASYKMMVRCGWNPRAGLGPEGAGPMQPVPTVLKRDQKGLGYGPMKRAKVTHFQAKDHEAVKASSKEKEERAGRGKRKEESKRKEEKDKNWERDFRASFYL